MNVGIVGLGLMGGSLAKSVKARTGHTVWGLDTDQETLFLARLCGAIDKTLDDETLPLCDLVIVAVSPGAAITWVEENGAKLAKSCILVDFCGVKRQVVGKIAPLAERWGFSYIGGHPMAGTERSGFVNASPTLYSGASMILTPDKRTDLYLLETLKAFFLDVGFANLTFTDPDEHDRMIAYTSQLAHLCSSAYVKSPTALKRRGFSSGSFRDMTRVARLDEKMWTELFLENSDDLLRELDLFLDHLQAYRAALAGGDRDGLQALLQEGREQKAAVGGD
jgi:prephenate dehydrogenase